MATMKLTLPDPVYAWVEEQAKTAQYAEPGDLMRDLINRENAPLDKIAVMHRLVDRVWQAA
jgi:antitoxin ParD1/3/4